MLSSDLNINHIKQDSFNVLNNFKNKEAIKKIGVFGSFARGDYTENSDIDLVIDYNYTKKDMFEDALNFFNFIDEIKDMFKNKYNKKTDIVEYAALKQRENRFLKKEIEGEIVWIYEQK
ncbi:MAG: nucleotidyltransferase domain-containing protein [Oscillospiraceae bacterium]|nr:nucleotidyltransferase domain-containing protein [Oscillospiraceae bacterium]